MSFALEYRKRLLARQKASDVADAEAFPAPDVDAAETSGNRYRVLCALVVAAVILATFNSGALVHYARGLADGPLGPGPVEVSESWHEMMEAKGITRLVEAIRGGVMGAREISWADLGAGLGLGRGDATAAPTGVAATDQDTITSSLPAEAQDADSARP